MAAGDRKSFFTERCHFFIKPVFWPKILGLAKGWQRNAAILRKKISRTFRVRRESGGFSTDSGTQKQWFVDVARPQKYDSGPLGA